MKTSNSHFLFAPALCPIRTFLVKRKKSVSKPLICSLLFPYRLSPIACLFLFPLNLNPLNLNYLTLNYLNLKSFSLSFLFSGFPTKNFGNDFFSYEP
jgi:hypothetical protein